MGWSRREFLQGLTSTAAGVAICGRLPAFGAEPAPARKLGPNDRINVAVVGFNGQGRTHINAYCGMKETQIVALCDVDKRLFPSASETVEKANGKAPKCAQDIRTILEDPNIDAVSIATTNHWHALAAIWAIQAGKHVYVEKPVSHNVWEGRKIVEFARKHNKIVQTGTQSRSHGGVREAMQFLHDGKLGKIKLARGICYKRRKSIDQAKGEVEVPKEIDYVLWLGPAPKRPLTRKKLHYDWHWVWDYGNGDLGNQGIHEMDICRWGLNKKELAKSVMSFGGRFGYQDDGETPNTQVIFLDYDDCRILFEVRGLNGLDPFDKKPLKGKDKDGKEIDTNWIGNIFYGSEGYLVIGDGEPTAFTPKGEKIQSFAGKAESHFHNFIKAVQSGKPSDLHADIEEGHLSSALCHLGNISYRLGTAQVFDVKAKKFGDDKDAYEQLARMDSHLNGCEVKLDGLQYTIGKKLGFDSKREQLTDDPKADGLLTREYREPFVVPKL